MTRGVKSRNNQYQVLGAKLLYNICIKIKLAHVRYEGRWVNYQAVRALEQVLLTFVDHSQLVVGNILKIY